MLISKKTNQAIRMSGLAALTLATACADDPATTPATGFDAGVVAATPDSGAAVVPGADASQCLTTQFGTGAQCTLPGGGFGYRMCNNGVPYGDCMSLLPEGGIGAILGEAGIGAIFGEAGIGAIFGEGGIGSILGDSGITLGDAGLNLEAGTIKCPAPLSCLDTFKSLTGGLSACGKMGDFLPPAGNCTGPSGACKIDTASGTCAGAIGINACVIPCN
jgi:hypothetical protein